MRGGIDLRMAVVRTDLHEAGAGRFANRPAPARPAINCDMSTPDTGDCEPLLVDGVPEALDALILGLLAKDRRDRVGYAADDAAALVAMKYAHEHLDPRDQVDLFAAVVEEAGPEHAGVRNVAYMLLIDALRESGERGPARDTVFRMIMDNLDRMH